MASKSIWLRRVWLAYDVLVIWMYSSYFFDSRIEDDAILLNDVLGYSSLFIAWIYFLIYSSPKEIFYKSLSFWVGWFLGFITYNGGGVEYIFESLKHVLVENHSFWLSEKPYVLMLIIFIMMLFNWIFAQIILKVVSYFRGNIDKGDRLL